MLKINCHPVLSFPASQNVGIEAPVSRKHVSLDSTHGIGTCLSTLKFLKASLLSGDPIPGFPEWETMTAFKVKLLRNVDSGSGSAKTTAKGLGPIAAHRPGRQGMN